MPVTTFHAAPTARGLGDGSSAANAGQLFPSGNLHSTIAGHDFSASCLEVLCQNTGTYTCSQSLAAAAFTTPPTASTYALFLKGCDSSGNPVVPADYGWRCEESDLNVTGFAVINFTLTSSPFLSALNIRMTFFDVTATNSGTVISQNIGKLTWCRFTITSTSDLTVAVLQFTNSQGMTNCQVRITGSSFAQLYRGSTAGGQLDNVRFKGDASATTGTRYGVSMTVVAMYPLGTGRLFVCDCPGAGIINYNTSTSSGIIVSNATVVNCGTGITSLGSTSSRLVVANSVVTGCTTGLNIGNGIYVLDNVVLRNTTNYGTAAAVPVSEPYAFITTETDSQLYTNPTAGDYRIKLSSSHWGKNRGAGDEASVNGTVQQKHGIYLGSRGIAV